MSANVYQMVTDRIIAELEKGLIPWAWERPWSGVKDGAYNRVTGKPYSLLNQMLLQHSGEYATFKQIFATMSSDELKKVATIKEFLFVATILIIFQPVSYCLTCIIREYEL